MDIEFYNKLNQALHGDAGKIDRVMRFRYLNEFVKPGQILFAGSSLMEQFPIQEFVADFDLPLTIYNRGVGGFTTSEMTICPAYCPSTAMWMIVPTLWQSWYGMFSWVISLLLPAATVWPSTQAVTP